MSDNDSYWFGLLTAAIIATVIWHIGEAACQNRHNVADCEWARTPFAPAVTEQVE